MKTRTLPAIGVVAVVLGIGGAVWLGGVGRPPDEVNAAPNVDRSAGEPALVEVTPMQVGPLATYIRATANLVAEVQVGVVAEVEGRIIRLAVREGEDVRRGALLATLNPQDASRARRSAAIKLEHADSLHRRGSTLADKNLVSSEELEQLTADLDLARQELAEAEASFSRTQVRAAVNGRITRRDVVGGQFVRPGDVLFEITDFDPLIAKVHVPERDALLIEPGREVELVLQANTDVRFKGRVRQVASVVDPQSGTVEVTIQAEEPPPEVRSGSFVSVRLVRESHLQARWLPREAVIVGPRGAHVFVVEDGTARRRTIVVGDEERGRVRIVEGLEIGELVVLTGHGALQDGSSVQLKSPTLARG
jgi:membrane fusion protein (multidrug efflux system)